MKRNHTPFLAFLLIIQATQTFDFTNKEQLLAEAQETFSDKNIKLHAYDNFACPVKRCTKTSPTEDGMKKHLDRYHDEGTHRNITTFETKTLYVVQVEDLFWLPGCASLHTTAANAFRYANNYQTLLAKKPALADKKRKISLEVASRVSFKEELEEDDDDNNVVNAEDESDSEWTEATEKPTTITGVSLRKRKRKRAAASPPLQVNQSTQTGTFEEHGLQLLASHNQNENMPDIDDVDLNDLLMVYCTPAS